MLILVLLHPFQMTEFYSIPRVSLSTISSVASQGAASSSSTSSGSSSSSAASNASAHNSIRSMDALCQHHNEKIQNKTNRGVLSKANLTKHDVSSSDWL